MKQPVFWVYILYCSNQSYYTGYTVDLLQRFHAHRRGIAAKYTRSFPPIDVAAVWPIFTSKQEAMQVECFLKALNKKTKEMLVQNPLELAVLFCEGFAALPPNS